MEMNILSYMTMGLVLLMAALGLIVWRLSRAVMRLRAENHELSRAMERQGNDLAGISSAGVHIDRLLIDHEKRLRECLERFDSIRTEPSPGMPYHGPIERIRKGASAEELVSEFGLSLSEANLLVRLHGSGK